MDKTVVIIFMKKNPFKRFKLDWWSDSMFFFYDGKNFISGGLFDFKDMVK